MAETKRKRMTKEEKRDWDALYEYVRKNVLGYDENQSLSKTMVLRLKGLLTNKFMENHNIADGSHYSYEVVLNTFKFCSTEIQHRLRVTNFRDEKHKFNYVLKIVEDNLNNVYLRMKSVKKAEEKTQLVDVSVATHVGAGYQKKTVDTSNNEEFDDLW